jgi:hypothetical protein
MPLTNIYIKEKIQCIEEIKVKDKSVFVVKLYIDIMWNTFKFHSFKVNSAYKFTHFELNQYNKKCKIGEETKLYTKTNPLITDDQVFYINLYCDKKILESDLYGYVQYKSDLIKTITAITANKFVRTPDIWCKENKLIESLNIQPVKILYFKIPSTYEMSSYTTKQNIQISVFEDGKKIPINKYINEIDMEDDVYYIRDKLIRPSSSTHVLTNLNNIDKIIHNPHKKLLHFEFDYNMEEEYNIYVCLREF